MDDATVQLLKELPTDLVERGWQLVVVESRVVQSADGPRYRAVYSRPFDIDDLLSAVDELIGSP